MYVADGTTNLDFGWNEILNNNANRAIQVYTSSTGESGLSLHDNFINNSRGVGILLGNAGLTVGVTQ